MSFSDLTSAFSQSSRLLKLTLAPGSGINEDTLLPYELSGTEGISEGFTYSLTCLSSDIHLELKEFNGLPVEITILTDDGSERALCGIVTAIKQEGGNGGFAKFTLTLQDPFAVLTRRINSRVFQDLSVLEFVNVILGEHRQNNSVLAECFDVKIQCTGNHQKQSWVTQFNESDTHFICRWLAQEGIAWYFEHGDAGTPSEHPKVTLVLFDDAHSLEEATADYVRFHRADGTEAEDAITDWHATRTLQSGSIQRSSFDHNTVVTNTQQEDSYAKQGSYGQRLAATLEDYRYDSHHAANDMDDYQRYGKLRMHAHAYATKCFTGFGTHRELAVGRYFSLRDHPVHDQDNPEDREFTITRHSLYAKNNLPGEVREQVVPLLAAASAGDALKAQVGGTDQSRPEETIYRTRFDVVRRGVPIVPAFSDTDHAKPVAPALMTATVVGPPGEEIYVNEDGCIKVRMRFTRNAGQDHAQGAGASNTDRDSIWIRVAQPWTGANYGHVWIPRIGDEVIVQYVNDDIDRPVVTSSLYNGTHRPATFSGAGSLPVNRPLSGVKTKEVKGSQYNELLFDDTTNEVRAKLSSEHGKTQLNLGYLIHPRTDGKGEPRGDGFELRTDASGAIRAAQGLFLTTEAQPVAAGKQQTRDHAQSQLNAALSLTKNLGAVATRQGGDTLEAGPEKISPDNAKGETVHNGHMQHHVDALKSWEAGSNTDKDGKTASNEAGRQPILVLSAPAGIVSVSAQNQTVAAGTNLDLVAQRDSNQSTGRRWVHNVGQHISLFVNGVKDKVALKLITAQGKMLLQAQSDGIEATADKDFMITSCKGKVVITGKEEILLTSGGGYIRLKDGNIDIHCPKRVSIKGEDYHMTGPDKLNPSHPAFPKNLPTKPLVFNADHSPQGLSGGWGGMPYKLFADGALVKEGVLEKGAPLLVDHPVPTAKYKIELANGLIYNMPIVTDYTNQTQGDPANQGFHRHVPGKAPDAGATKLATSAREAYLQALTGLNETDAT